MRIFPAGGIVTFPTKLEDELVTIIDRSCEVSPGIETYSKDTGDFTIYEAWVFGRGNLPNT